MNAGDLLRKAESLQTEIAQLKEISKDEYDKGYIDGMTAYAQMTSGITYYGTIGTILKEAIEKRKGNYNYNNAM